MIVCSDFSPGVDDNFSWVNAGAMVFGASGSSEAKSDADKEGSDEEEAPKNVDIHFEPIVSLPEVLVLVLCSIIERLKGQLHL